MTLNRVIEKLRKIKAHSESAEKIGSIDEAETFAAMFQQLLLKHKLETTDIEFEEEEKDEPVDQHVVDWQELRFGKQSKRVAWIERLARIISRAYFCRFLVTSRSARITLVGRKTDTEVAEYMLVTLVRIAERLVRKEYSAFRKEHPHGETKGFNRSFMIAFANRLSERYDEERRSATTESTALVRINRAESAVKDYMKQYTRLGAGIGPRGDGGNQEGFLRGHKVADSLNLKANVVKSGRSTKRLS